MNVGKIDLPCQSCPEKDLRIARLERELAEAREINSKILESISTDTGVRIIQKMIDLEKQNPNNLG